MRNKENSLQKTIEAVLHFTAVEDNLPDAFNFLEDWFLCGIESYHYDCEDSRVNAVSTYRTLKTLLKDIAEIDRDKLLLAKK